MQVYGKLNSTCLQQLQQVKPGLPRFSGEDKNKKLPEDSNSDWGFFPYLIGAMLLMTVSALLANANKVAPRPNTSSPSQTIPAK